jgi:hypothetical protein
LATIGTHQEYDAHPIFEVIYDPTEIARLRGHLQIEGEIILWTTFWVNVSKLMMGATLDELIQCENMPAESKTTGTGTGNNNNNNNNNPELSTLKRKRSDSEIARDIQAQFDADPNFDLASFLEQQQLEQLRMEEEQEKQQQQQSKQEKPAETRLRSDSEIARELQDQWDHEEASQLANPDQQQGGPPPLMMAADAKQLFPSSPRQDKQQQQPEKAKDDKKAESKFSPRSPLHRSDSIAGEDSPANTLYHFNGLQGMDRSSLTTLTLRRR